MKANPTKATQYMEELEIRMFDANKRSLETLKMMKMATKTASLSMAQMNVKQKTLDAQVLLHLKRCQANIRIKHGLSRLDRCALSKLTLMNTWPV